MNIMFFLATSLGHGGLTLEGPLLFGKFWCYLGEKMRVRCRGGTLSILIRWLAEGAKPQELRSW